jgi:hypothetical protein
MKSGETTSKIPVKYVVLTWDWSEHLEISDLRKALKELNANVSIVDVDTGGDTCAIVISTSELSKRQAKRILDKEYRS